MHNVERPLHSKIIYLLREVACALSAFLTLRSITAELGGRHSQVGSLAGAVHLLNVNAGVLWKAQREQKSLVD